MEATDEDGAARARTVEIAAGLAKIGLAAEIIDEAALARLAASLLTQLARGQVCAAYVGDKSRDRQSFLNAWCGADVVPTSVGPEMEVVVAYGPRLRAFEQWA